MVAYSFKKQFAAPILAGTKGGTIRLDRKRHARPGEELQLYQSQRTKQCRLITRQTCLDAMAIALNFPVDAVLLSNHNHPLKRFNLLDIFARFDGFPDWAALKTFWREEHGPDLKPFAGVHIRWLDWPKELLP